MSHVQPVCSNGLRGSVFTGQVWFYTLKRRGFFSVTHCTACVGRRNCSRSNITNPDVLRIFSVWCRRIELPRASSSTPSAPSGWSDGKWRTCRAFPDHALHHLSKSPIRTHSYTDSRGSSSAAVSSEMILRHGARELKQRPSDSTLPPELQWCGDCEAGLFTRHH